MKGQTAFWEDEPMVLVQVAAEDDSGLPPDESARRVIRGVGTFAEPISRDPEIVLDRNLVVRAGAGSGKTRSLVERLVALIRSGVPARRIAAITFTIKAAGELRVRFSSALGEAARQVSKRLADTEDAEWQAEYDRLREAERDLEHIFIGTVHAFCGRILRERPFAAGLAPDFEHIDPDDVMEHRRRFWSRFVSREASRWADRFAAVDLDPDDLFRFFADCANNEDVPLDGLALQPVMPDLAGASTLVVEWVREVTARTRLVAASDKALPRFRALERFIDLEGEATPVARAAILRRASRLKSSEVTLKRWGVSGSDLYALAKEVKDKTDAFVKDVVEPALTSWREFVFFEAGQFVQEAVNDYAQERREAGEQTFDDLLWGASRMLKSSAENRGHFADKFSHILVDEFQDTDPVQAEILLYLTSTNRDEPNPWRCEPRPGSLFIVGDDKQSIYRFRRADVEVFRRFDRVLNETGGQRVALTTNFRSDGRVCEFVNRAMMPAFSDPTKPGQADWEDLVPFHRTGARKQPVAVAKVEIPDKIYVRDAPAVEASQVAAAISEIVRRQKLTLNDGLSHDLTGDIGFGDIMIIFRVSTQMPAFVRELNRLEIPYSIAGGKTLRESESLRVLLDPLVAVLKQDPVALAAFLRGPLCGASDTELLDFVEAGGGIRMPIRRDGLIEPPESVARGFEMIQDLAARLRHRAPADAIESWVHEQGVLAGLAVREGGGGFGGSMVRILALCRKWDSMGLSWPEVVEELHRLVDREIEAEQLTLDALERPAVQLITVHQAKGLESKVVFLADLHSMGQTGSNIFIDRRGDQATLSAKITAWDRQVIACTPDWKEREVRDLALEQAENVRLGYVGATRAEELLIVSAHSRATKGVWLPFARELLNVPALAGSPVGPERAEEPALEDLSAIIEVEEASLRAAVQPSYWESTASEGTEQHFDMQDEGRGKDFGNLIHRLFESMVTHRERALDGSWIQRVAARYANEVIETANRPQRTMQAMRAAEAFLNSQTWQALAGADEVHAELPYTYVTPAADGELETVHSGIIDLAYRTGATWTVVDYKTDPLAPDDLVEKHEEQVEAYAQALRELAGATAVRNAIWSTHHGELIRLN